jgi:hypothetical protein
MATMHDRLTRQGQTYDRMAKKYGLATSREYLAGPRRYRWDLIERNVIALLSRRRGLPTGSRGTYPRALVNYLASIYLTCCMIEKRAPWQELIALVSEQLNVAHFGLKGGKGDALAVAQQLRREKPDISNRALAKTLKVETSTIGHWVKKGLLQPASC